MSERQGYLLLVEEDLARLGEMTTALASWARERGLFILMSASIVEARAMLAAEGSRVFIMICNPLTKGVLDSEFLIEIGRSYPELVTLLLTGLARPSEARGYGDEAEANQLRIPFDLRLELAMAFAVAEKRRFAHDSLAYLSESRF